MASKTEAASDGCEKLDNAIPIVDSVAEDVKEEKQPRMLEVTAPSTLPENYSFDVLVDGRSLTVAVPPGGAKEGEKMFIPFPDGWTATRNVSAAPIGRWKVCLYVFI